VSGKSDKCHVGYVDSVNSVAGSVINVTGRLSNVFDRTTVSAGRDV
jgi:hypothetical protein